MILEGVVVGYWRVWWWDIGGCDGGMLEGVVVGYWRMWWWDIGGRDVVVVVCVCDGEID